MKKRKVNYQKNHNKAHKNYKVLLKKKKKNKYCWWKSKDTERVRDGQYLDDNGGEIGGEARRSPRRLREK